MGHMGEATRPSNCGYEAETLDPVIAAARERLSTVIADVERVRGSLEPQLNEIRLRVERMLANPDVQDAALMVQAERQIEWLEKYARVALNFTKILDEASRLRSFVAGGADSRPDVRDLSDAQLAEAVRAAAGK